MRSSEFTLQLALRYVLVKGVCGVNTSTFFDEDELGDPFFAI